MREPRIARPTAVAVAREPARQAGIMPTTSGRAAGEATWQSTVGAPVRPAAV